MKRVLVVNGSYSWIERVKSFKIVKRDYSIIEKSAKEKKLAESNKFLKIISYTTSGLKTINSN